MTLRVRASLNLGPTCLICLTLVPALVPPISLILHLGPIEEERLAHHHTVLYDGTQIRAKPSRLKVLMC